MPPLAAASARRSGVWPVSGASGAWASRNTMPRHAVGHAPVHEVDHAAAVAVPDERDVEQVVGLDHGDTRRRRGRRASGAGRARGGVRRARQRDGMHRPAGRGEQRQHGAHDHSPTQAPCTSTIASRRRASGGGRLTSRCCPCGRSDEGADRSRALVHHGQELLLELCDRDAHGVDRDGERGDDLAGVVTDRDGERAQPGLEQAVGDDVAVGADLAGVLVVGAARGGRAGSGRATSGSPAGAGRPGRRRRGSATAASWRRRA